MRIKANRNVNFHAALGYMYITEVTSSAEQTRHNIILNITTES